MMSKMPEIKGVYSDWKESDIAEKKDKLFDVKLTEDEVDRCVHAINEFVIKTPSANSNCTQSITATIDSEYITLSDTEYGSQYITIPLDKWQELKELIDSKIQKT